LSSCLSLCSGLTLSSLIGPLTGMKIVRVSAEISVFYFAEKLFRDCTLYTFEKKKKKLIKIENLSSRRASKGVLNCRNPLALGGSAPSTPAGALKRAPGPPAVTARAPLATLRIGQYHFSVFFLKVTFHACILHCATP
jgi:hypothetical protein